MHLSRTSAFALYQGLMMKNGYLMSLTLSEKSVSTSLVSYMCDLDHQACTQRLFAVCWSKAISICFVSLLVLTLSWTNRGELYPCETDQRLADELQTGDRPSSFKFCVYERAGAYIVSHNMAMKFSIASASVKTCYFTLHLSIDSFPEERSCFTGQEVEVDMDNDTLTDIQTGKIFNLKPLGEVSALTAVSVLLSNLLDSRLLAASSSLLDSDFVSKWQNYSYSSSSQGQ